MKAGFIKFAKNTFFFSLILAIICFTISFFLPAKYLTPSFPYLFIFFFAITLVVHYILMKASEKRMSKFVNYFMLATFLKLMLYIMILVIYVLFNRFDAIPFILTFFILYLFFTVFEIISILSFIKRANMQTPKAKCKN